MTNLTKVSMNLTDKDVENTEHLKQRFHSRNNAEAVSASLAMCSALTGIIDKGDELVIRKKHGESEKVIIPGLNA